MRAVLVACVGHVHTPTAPRMWLRGGSGTEGENKLEPGTSSRCLIKYSSSPDSVRITSGVVDICYDDDTVRLSPDASFAWKEVVNSDSPSDPQLQCVLTAGLSTLLQCQVGHVLDIDLVRTYDDIHSDETTHSICIDAATSITLQCTGLPLVPRARLRTLPASWTEEGIATAVMTGSIVSPGSQHILYCLGNPVVVTVTNVVVTDSPTSGRGGSQVAVVTADTQVDIAPDAVASTLYPASEDSEQRGGKGVGTVSTGWLVRGCTRTHYQSPSVPDSAGQWRDRVRHYVGGADAVIEQVTTQLYRLMQWGGPQQQQHHTVSRRLARGLLFTGASGAGKTLLAQTLARESGLPYITLPISQAFQHGEATLQGTMARLARQARIMAPCFIVLDELDTLGRITCAGSALEMGRGEGQGVENIGPTSHHESRSITAVYHFLSQVLGDAGMDSTHTSTSRTSLPVYVIATTAQPELLEPLFTRAGFLTDHYHLQLTDANARRAALQVITRNMPIEQRDEVVSYIAEETFGFLGADLQLLCKEAALEAIREQQQQAGERQGDREAVLPTRLGMPHFQAARQRVRPARLTDLLLQRPVLSFQDLAGIEPLIQQLRLYLVWPLTRPEVYSGAGAQRPSGVLLYGPPGTGKTALAQCVAREAKASFIPLRATDMISKVVGQAEAFIHQVFRLARQSAPCILFIDQIEAIAPARQGGSKSGDRSLSALLTEMDGIMTQDHGSGSGGVCVLAATTERAALDPAILRPGRLSQHLHVALPDPEARRAILAKLLTDIPHTIGDDDLDQMAISTARACPADLANVCREAAMHALRRDVGSGVSEQCRVTPADLRAAWEHVKGPTGCLERIHI